MKRLASQSQYFLRSPRVVKELVGHSTLKKTDLVLDIGAGSGIISSVLATRVGRVIAYETEPNTAKKLRENTEQYPNLTIIEQDFLDEKLPNEPYKVFANIPFHLSSPIVRKLTEADPLPNAIYLIVQRQFANKLLINDERFTGQMGAMIAPMFAVRIRKKLERSDYWPHPNVDTVMVELLLRAEPLVSPVRIPKYRQFITDCFSTPKIYLAMPLVHVGISPETKPSQLLLNQWLALFSAQTKY